MGGKDDCESCIKVECVTLIVISLKKKKTIKLEYSEVYKINPNIMFLYDNCYPLVIFW